MNKITLENFRCFRGKQEARLAPLTLLVGENSTGKTSFLALVRALWDAAYGNAVPDFKKSPYDLGTFDEIAHHRGGKGGRATSFWVQLDDESPNGLIRYQITFGREGSAPIPMSRILEQNDIRVEHQRRGNNDFARLRLGLSKNGEWTWKSDDLTRARVADPQEYIYPIDHFIWKVIHSASGNATRASRNNKVPNKQMTDEDLDRLKTFSNVLRIPSFIQRPFASAPVRSEPRRTYDPARPTSDPEGMGVPMYLAEMHFHGGEEWARLSSALNKFGKDAGLFDEITVKRFAPTLSSPFQLQVKKHGDKMKGPWRNLIDVGYGVSQALPIITELLRRNLSDTFLLQQPEVHLHPSAQAALGSLFCEIAGSGRQLVVETHSDHLLERVRLDIRDGKSDLKPEDVSILYFERDDIEVNIRSLGLDKDGNILNAPPSYGKFFMEETKRSLKL